MEINPDIPENRSFELTTSTNVRLYGVVRGYFNGVLVDFRPIGNGYYVGNLPEYARVTLKTPMVRGNWTFDNWSGDARGNNNVTTITITGPKEVVANYRRT